MTRYIRFVGRMLAIGLVMGPVNHGWYFALDKLLIGKSATVITKKILLDQIIASPLFASIFFMGECSSITQERCHTNSLEELNKFHRNRFTDQLLVQKKLFISLL